MSGAVGDDNCEVDMTRSSKDVARKVADADFDIMVEVVIEELLSCISVIRVLAIEFKFVCIVPVVKGFVAHTIEVVVVETAGS